MGFFGTEWHLINEGLLSWSLKLLEDSGWKGFSIGDQLVSML